MTKFRSVHFPRTSKGLILFQEYAMQYYAYFALVVMIGVMLKIYFGQNILWFGVLGMAAAIGLSPHTLKSYRLKGILTEGIHWTRINTRCVRYNRELIQDWVCNRHAPSSHQKAIEQYLNSLSCNHKGRKTKTKQRSA